MKFYINFELIIGILKDENGKKSGLFLNNIFIFGKSGKNVFYKTFYRAEKYVYFFDKVVFLVKQNSVKNLKNCDT